MKKPKVLIFSGYGFNSEAETKYGFEVSGAAVDIVHINDLIDGLYQLTNYHILVFPGGFSYGDDTGSGNAYANKVKNHLWEAIQKCIEKDTLVIGICNGFQTLVNLGLLPALNKQYGKKEVALLHNDSARLTTRWTDLKVENKSPWLANMDSFSLPIAHGEGKFYASKIILDMLESRGLIALRYVAGETSFYQNMQVNPNGSLENIAGITDETGRIFGLMPHPERGMFFTQLPQWPLLKEKYKREGKDLPEFAAGMQIFKNAVGYFS